MPDPDASHSTKNVLEKSGNWSTGAVERAFFNATNALLDSSVQQKASFFSNLVSGAAIVP
jgi:hypothetical protein